MSNVFGATSTADEVLSGVDLRGKRILVTGVSAGIGVETARALAARGARVIGAVRDLVKAERATAHMRSDVAASGGSFELVRLDLASLKSVRACAAALAATGEPLDLIIANAAVMATPFTLTEDGFETQFGTNHLGHFVLINRLASLIRSGGRVVSLSSSGHRIANVDLADPNFERTPYQPYRAYGRSKTANILFAVGFDRRHRDRGVRAAAVHPGGIRDGDRPPLACGPRARDDRAAEPAARRRRQAAVPVEVDRTRSGDLRYGPRSPRPPTQIGGRYCENCHVGSDRPGRREAQLATARASAAYALDPENAEALWKKSEQMVLESF